MTTNKLDFNALMAGEDGGMKRDKQLFDEQAKREDKARDKRLSDQIIMEGCCREMQLR